MPGQVKVSKLPIRIALLVLVATISSADALQSYKDPRTSRHAHQFARSRSEHRNGSIAARDGNDARFTYYQVGEGSCGSTNSADEYVVAISAEQWDGGAHCFSTITVAYQGMTAQAQVVDQCDGCPPGGLDMSQGLFSYFAGTDQGMIYGDWSYGSGAPSPSPSPTSNGNGITSLAFDNDASQFTTSKDEVDQASTKQNAAYTTTAKAVESVSKTKTSDTSLSGSATASNGTASRTSATADLIGNTNPSNPEQTASGYQGRLNVIDDSNPTASQKQNTSATPVSFEGGSGWHESSASRSPRPINLFLIALLLLALLVWQRHLL